MATVAHPHQPTFAGPRATAAQSMEEARKLPSSSREHTSESSSISTSHPPTPAAVQSKKGKAKKAADPIDASKQIAAKIAQLEQDAAGEKDLEAEIDREVKKANRDLSNLLSTMETPIRRLEVVQKKYSELLADMKRTEREQIKAKKRADQLQKEKDAGRAELNKISAVKDKLEKLSREVTKENKKLKDDVKRLEENESSMREELHARLEQMVSEVSQVVNDRVSPETQGAHMEMDELFRQKFKSLIEQYELRELHFHSLLRTKELEIQYQIARVEQQKKIQEIESSKSHQLTKQVSTFSQTETELRSQLNIYVEKFKQVEDTLNNSNDLFLTFRKEMEEMSKKTKRLEKENLNLTRKQEATNRNILEMAEERTRTQKELELLRKKNENLEKLCRGMQAQGRGHAPITDLEEEDEDIPSGSDSDYGYDDVEDEEGSAELESDDETEEERVELSRKPFGPVPPPQPQTHTAPKVKANGPTPRQLHSSVNGQVNGVKY